MEVRINGEINTRHVSCILGQKCQFTFGQTWSIQWLKTQSNCGKIFHQNLKFCLLEHHVSFEIYSYLMSPAAIPARQSGWLKLQPLKFARSPRSRCQLHGEYSVVSIYHWAPIQSCQLLWPGCYIASSIIYSVVCCQQIIPCLAQGANLLWRAGHG